MGCPCSCSSSVLVRVQSLMSLPPPSPKLPPMPMPTPTQAFLEARDFLIAHREDYAAAFSGFRWTQLDRFNWALDFFDVQARGNDRTALWIVDDEGHETRLSFADMAR